MKSNLINRSLYSVVMAVVLVLTLIFVSTLTPTTINAEVLDLPYDMNCDGGENLNDVSTLAQYVAGWELKTYNAEKMDTDQNGVINLQDVSTTAQYVAGWNITENYSVNYGKHSWPTLSATGLEAGYCYSDEENVLPAEGDLQAVLLSAEDNETLNFNVACNIEDDTVTAVLPAGTHINSMKARFVHQGESLTYKGNEVISGETSFDFRNPVTLTLTKGEVEKEYTLYITVLNTGLPSISITTENMEEIDSKVEKKNCSVFAGGGSYDGYSFGKNDYVLAEGTVKGRGWTSWYYYPKKSYTLKFNKKQSLVGLPAHKEWVLAANFADRSLLRNATGMELAKIMGMETVMDVKFVDLWVNGEYVGNYNLIEKIEVDENRVDITDFDETLSPSQIGYIVETNGHNKATGEFGVWTNGQDADRVEQWQQLNEYTTYDPISGDIFFTSKHYSSVFNINKPSDGKLMDLSEEKMLAYIEYIYNYMDNMEAAIKSQNYTLAEKYLDMESMAKWYIVEELSMNTDSRLHCSCYMYKDAGGKMKMGPVWDFDLGFGNGKYANNNNVTETYLDNSTWFKDLLAMPEFKAIVKQVWNEHYEDILELCPFIKKSANMIDKSQELNYTWWSITEPGEHCYTYTTEEIATYDEHIEYLVEFTSMRIAYMELKIDKW